MEIDGTGDRYIEYTDEEGNTMRMGEVQTPYLLAYNKDAVDEDGFPAPIIAYMEDAHYSLGTDMEDYIYKADNYAAYREGVYQVFQTYGKDRGEEIQDITLNREAE